MDKKKRTILCAVIALVIGAAVIALCCAGGGEAPAANSSGAAMDETEQTAGETGAAAEDTPAETEPSAGDEVSAQLGVGTRGDYAEDSTAEGQQTEKPTEGEKQPDNQTQGSAAPEQPEDQMPDTTGPQVSEPTSPTDDGKSTVTFAEYEAMSEEEQEAFFDSFESVKAFNEWWHAAQKEKEDRESSEIVDGNVDLGKLP